MDFMRSKKIKKFEDRTTKGLNYSETTEFKSDKINDVKENTFGKNVKTISSKTTIDLNNIDLSSLETFSDPRKLREVAKQQGWLSMGDVEGGGFSRCYHGDEEEEDEDEDDDTIDEKDDHKSKCKDKVRNVNFMRQNILKILCFFSI